jgi:VTT domain
MHASAPLKEYFRVTDQPTVLFARFFPVLRQLNGIVAGALGMSWWRFLLFNAIGAALWVGAWVFIAVYFSEHAAATAQFANNLVFAAGRLRSGNPSSQPHRSTTSPRSWVAKRCDFEASCVCFRGKADMTIALQNFCFRG